MANLNRVIIIGNLTRDVEIRQLPSGSSVANLGVAINESFMNKAGERKESTTFVDIEVWGSQADTCSKYLSKGRQVLVEGRLKLDQWEHEGQKRSKLKVIGERMQMLGTRGGGGGGGGGARPPQQQQQPDSQYSQPAPADDGFSAAPTEQQSGGDDIPF